MKITWLARFVPSSRSDSAGSDFFFHYLAALAEHHDARLVAPDDGDNRAAAADAPPGVQVHLVPVATAPSTSVGRTLAALPSLPGGLSPGANILRGIRADARTWSMARDSDLVEVHWAEFLPFVADVRREAPGVPVTALTHEVFAVAVARRAAEAVSRSERVSARLSVRRVRRSEPALMNLCDHVFVLSDNAAAGLRDLGVRTPMTVLDPYVRVPADPVGPAGREQVLFVGAMHIAQNWEPAMWFIEEVWPQVIRRRPHARLVVAGGGPPPQLLAKASDDVAITGWVENLDEVFRQADVSIAPIRSGGGPKFKVPQAMLYGLPVVATSVAAEGIVEVAGDSVFGAVTDDVAEMSDAIVELLANPARAHEIGRRSREWAAARYSFDRTISLVLDAYDSIQRSRGAA